MKRIVKQKRLDENLMEMSLGSVVEVLSRDYKANVVRSTIYKLNQRGYSFVATEKGLIDSVQVTRLR